MSASPEMNENFVNDLRELMAKYNIQHAQMNVELINSNNNKDNDTNSNHANKVEITKEATPTPNKAHVNVVITNNEVKCPPLLSPNKTIKNAEENVANANKKVNDATDAESDTKTSSKALPLMETNKMSLPVTHASHHFTDKSNTQINASEELEEQKEKNIERLENIRPYVVSQPAAPLSEIPRKQDVLPHSHSVSERRTHLCSPPLMSGVNIPCTTTSTATASINTEAKNVKENREVKGQRETRTVEQQQHQRQQEDNALANISQSINNANAPRATSPVSSTAINTHLEDNTQKESNTHSSEKSSVELIKETKPTTTNSTEGSSTLHSMMADAAASGMAIPEDLQLHLAQEEQRQKRIAILNSFVGKSALLQDKAEREKMNAEASNSIRRTSNTSKNGTFANRFMFGANRLSVSNTADASSKNNSADDVNSCKNKSHQQASQQQQQQEEMVKNDKLPPITYTPDCHITCPLPSPSHLNGAATTTTASTVTNKADNNDMGHKDLTNAHVSNASPTTLSSHSPTQPSEKVSVEIDAKLFTDICRENSRQAARLRPHLSESFAPVATTTTNTNTETKANQSGRGSACGLKEMLKEQQNMELQSREELLKHAELMAKAKAVIDHADHIEYKPHSTENKMHQANRTSINSTTIGTTTSTSLPYSLTRNPHNDITVAQNNAKVAEGNAKSNYNTSTNATTTTSSNKQMPSVNEKITPPLTTTVDSNAESAKRTNNNSSSNCNSSNRTPSVNSALEEKENKRKSQIELVSITLPQADTEARSEAINRFAKEPTLIQYLQGKDKYDALLASQKKELTEHQKETKDYKELVNQAVQFNKKIGIS